MNHDSRFAASRADLIWIILFAIALIVGAWIRFDDLAIKPLHHDEGVNAFFLLNLARQGKYAYNPENYHGPTLYYFALVALKTIGETDFALRLWPALTGFLTLLLLWMLRPHLGMAGAVVAGALLAVSPGLVYFARDFIHESSFGFFTLALVAALLRYYSTKQFKYLGAAAAAAALLFATKETAIITLIVLALAALSSVVWDETRRMVASRSWSIGHLTAALKAEARRLLPPADQLLAAGVIFAFINVIFYTSFLTNPRGILDAIQSVFLWAGRSGREHVHAFDYYLGILCKLELPLLIAALAGAIVVLIAGSRFGLFLGAWTLGIFLAYSLIPYKTPWLIVNLLIPLGLLAGYGAGRISHLLPRRAAPLLPAALIILAGVPSALLAWRINFVAYDDNRNAAAYFAEMGARTGWRAYRDEQYGYVYAQTDRRLLELVQAIANETARRPTGRSTGIELASPAYWPLPWYLRDYPQVAFTGHLPEGGAISITEPLLIANATQREQIEALGRYQAATRPVVLRPGEELILYLRRED